MNYDFVSLKGKYYLKYMVHRKRKENGEKVQFENCTSKVGHWKLSEQLKWPSYDRQGIYKEWVTVKHPEASQISDWKKGQWGDLNFGGWSEEAGDPKMVEGHQEQTVV